MKKISLLLLLIGHGPVLLAQNSVPNPGFELWNGSPLSPDNWNANNSTGTIPITQTSGFYGSYAAQGSVVPLFPDLILSPYLEARFPVTQYFTSLQFYYTVNLDSGDVFEISAAIYDASNNFLASNFMDLDVSTSSPTFFSMHVDSIAAGIPDHASVAFTILPAPTASVPHLGSSFVVDEVELLRGPDGIKDPGESINCRIFPNPASHSLCINMEIREPASLLISMMDVYGRIVLQKQTDVPVLGKISEILNVENIPPGIYTIAMIGRKETRIRKIVVK